MSQSEQSTVVTSKETVLNFLSALKAGSKPNNGEGGLFASLMSETKAIPVEANVSDGRIEIERPSVRRADDNTYDHSQKKKEGVRPASERAQISERPAQEDKPVKVDSDKLAVKEVPAHQEQKEISKVPEKTEEKEAAPVKSEEEEVEESMGEQSVAAAVAENMGNEETSESDTAFMAFLDSLNPLAEKNDMTVGEDEKVVAEDSEKDMIDVAAHIEAEIKSLLGTRKQGEEINLNKTSDVKSADSSEGRASLESALTMKAQMRNAKEGDVELVGEGKKAVTDEGMEFEMFTARAADGKAENPYSLDNKEGSKSFDVEDVFLSRKQEAVKTEQTPLMTSMSGENLKKALENLTSANTNVKVASAGEVSQNNHLSGGIQSTDSYSFSSQLSAARVTKGGNTGLPTPAEQIAVQVNKMAKDGKEEMTINLKPAELGKVQVKLEFVGDHKVHASISADSQNSLDLLMKDQDSLQRALENAGLQLDAGSMEFSLNENNQQQSFEQERLSRNNENMIGVEEDIIEVVDDSEIYYVTPGHVNLRV